MVLVSPVSSFRSRRLRKKLLFSITPQTDVKMDYSDTLSVDMKPLKWDEYCAGAELMEPRLTGESDYTTTTAASSSFYGSYYIPEEEDVTKPKKPVPEPQERKTVWKGLFAGVRTVLSAAKEGFCKMGFSWGMAWTTTRTKMYTRSDGYE